jgi:hypothetical protein
MPGTGVRMLNATFPVRLYVHCPKVDDIVAKAESFGVSRRIV